jgi:hypothetical protein
LREMRPIQVPLNDFLNPTFTTESTDKTDRCKLALSVNEIILRFFSYPCFP